MNKPKISKITCCYKNPCYISMEKLDGKDVLKLDFRIKTYKILKQGEGWVEHDFPPDIIINDKLYLDENMKNLLIKAFDVFIKTGYLNNVYLKTERGFSYNDWKDLKGNTIHIQESSAARDSFIWFGGKMKDIFVPTESGMERFNFPQDDFVISDCMHLNITKVKKLKEIIQNQWMMNEVKNLNEELPINTQTKNKSKI